MNINRILSLFLLLSLTFFSYCDKIDLFDYAQDKALGPRFLTFSLDGINGSINIKDATVLVKLPSTCDPASMVPEFTISGDHVEYSGTTLISGSTSINFTNSVIMTVYLEGGVSREFTISAARLENLTITPSSPAVGVTQTLQFTATGYYSNGGSYNVTTATSWSSDNEAIATINAQGGATGVSVGTVTINASLGGLTINITLEVTAVLDQIIISLGGNQTNTEDLELGETLSFEATAVYIGTTDVNVTAAATWSSTNASVSSVTGGTVQALSVGSANIQASYGGVTGSVTLNGLSRSTYYVSTSGIDTGFGSLGDPLASISQALSMASEGNEIRVGAGTFTDNILLEKNVLIYGCWDMGADIQDTVNISTTLIGNEASSGYAIGFDGSVTPITSSTIIDNIQIEGGSVASGSCCAVGIQYNASPIIQNCKITGADNTATNSYGIYIYESSPTIRQCVVSGGSGSFNSYGIFMIYYSNPAIERNQINGGSSTTYSCALTMADYSTPVIRNNIIVGGSGLTSVAINMISAGTTQIHNNTINLGTGSSDSIYGIQILDSTPNIANNILYCTGSASTSMYGICESNNTGCTPAALRYNWVYLPAGTEYVILATDYDINLYGYVSPYEINYDDIAPAIDSNFYPTNYDTTKSDGAADLESEGMGFNEDYYGSTRPTGDWAIGAVEY